uniref:Uncharacterized protein n=1 Tax=Physcomitrium patens TaxID=3218 RepID=A0A2K1K769_PHYPA|nr:hypothetical protein PHYPA_011518 [Physcomitrium patens]
MAHIGFCRSPNRHKPAPGHTGKAHRVSSMRNSAPRRRNFANPLHQFPMILLFALVSGATATGFATKDQKKTC